MNQFYLFFSALSVVLRMVYEWYYEWYLTINIFRKMPDAPTKNLGDLCITYLINDLAVGSLNTILNSLINFLCIIDSSVSVIYASTIATKHCSSKMVFNIFIIRVIMNIFLSPYHIIIF